MRVSLTRIGLDLASWYLPKREQSLTKVSGTELSMLLMTSDIAWKSCLQRELLYEPFTLSLIPYITVLYFFSCLGYWCELELGLSCGELAVSGFMLVATWAYVPDRGLLLVFKTGASDGSFDLSVDSTDSRRVTCCLKSSIIRLCLLL